MTPFDGTTEAKDPSLQELGQRAGSQASRGVGERGDSLVVLTRETCSDLHCGLAGRASPGLHLEERSFRSAVLSPPLPSRLVRPQGESGRKKVVRSSGLQVQGGKE